MAQMLQVTHPRSLHLLLSAKKTCPNAPMSKQKVQPFVEATGLAANLQQLKSVLPDPPPMPPSISWAATSIESKLQPAATPSPIPIDDSPQRMRTPAVTISPAIHVSSFTLAK